ncbi:hypothetical protein SKAU_G00302280 [Synaphobranchus kaupii]|uniref:Uncharacterized protein n=1 Tax=Synaphobranchus kaupii TaxID=118154 RepID=A0A9Q1EVW5_SYNKA|nr:hypothetical protein SKAU_G00302280 [Synaphobranchus kaupii]
MSPASNAIMVARKRLLEKALLHKARMREMSAQPGPQMGQLYGRSQACFQGNDARKITLLPQTSTLGMTSARLPQARGGLEPQPVPVLPKRTLQQRAGPPARSLHPPLQREPPPCIAVRPPNPAPAPPAGRTPPGATQDGGLRGGLQEQVQVLGAEIRGLGMAVRLMVEQQSRVEREQAQQTQVQRQILSTLQALASSLRPAKTPTPPGPAPYRQEGHTPTRTTYAQCSQPPLSKYCELDASGLDSLEAYKLSGLSPPRVNGFPACATADGSLALGAQGHAPAYEAFAQSYGSPPYSAQSHTPAYSQAYSQGCSPAASLNPDSPLPLSPQDPQLNIVKVETM